MKFEAEKYAVYQDDDDEQERDRERDTERQGEGGIILVKYYFCVGCKAV